jgi:hypothetical protein
VVTLKGKYSILAGEKMEIILAVAPALALEDALERTWPRKRNFDSKKDLSELLESLTLVLAPALWKQGKTELGFLCLFTDGAGNYWYKCSRGFHTALNESLSSVESLIDELVDNVAPERKEIVNQMYRRLNSYLA